MVPLVGLVYVGGAFDTFRYGSSGELRDRQLRYRLDLYAHVERERWTLAVDGPLVHNRIRDLPETPPAPCSSDYCDPVTTVGEVGLQARYALREWVTPMLGVRSDFWNAGTRHRWANAGQGATSLVGTVGLVARPGAWQLTATPYYAFVLGTQVGDERLPHDHAGGSVAVARTLGWTWSELGLRGWTRLGGVDHGPDWSAYSSEWRWAALRYRELRAEASTGLEVGGVWVSLYGNRVIWQRNGPRDSWQVGLGVARTVGG